MKIIKVIDKQPKNNFLDEQEMKSNEPSLKNNSYQISIQRNQSLKKIYRKYIFFPILAMILVGILFIVVILSKNPQREENQNEISNKENLSFNKPEKPYEYKKEKIDFKELALKYGPIEVEKAYKINTNVNDLKCIYINQRYYEDIKISGSLKKRLADRKTNYDIYVINETEPDEETKYFYNKIYTCSISIASECISTKDEYCLPRKLVDLNDQDYSSIIQLNKIESLENISIPICIFNMTDNNVILSIACHKNISNSRISSIIQDLYFFRPPGIKKIDKETGNITTTQRADGDYEYIRKTKGGICDIENSNGTFCTKDINITKDKNGNLLAYDEMFFSNITQNEENYYFKNKITSLLDKTKFIKELNPMKYNKTLYKLLPYLKEYMKVHEQFSSENFKELYYHNKGLINVLDNKRSLEEPKQTQLIYSVPLFNYTHYSGINILIRLRNSLNNEIMKASSDFLLENEETQIGYISTYSNFGRIMKDIVLSSTAGKNLAFILYSKINGIYLDLRNIINTDIPSLNNLVKYKELSDIFDIIFSSDTLKAGPLTKNEMLTHLEKNIKIFKDELDLSEFVDTRNNIYTEIKNNNIDEIKNAINSYGKEEYPNILYKEILKLQDRRVRRLNGEVALIDIYEEKKEEIKEDLKEDIKENIKEDIKEIIKEDSISQILNKLLNKSENIIHYIKTFESFDKFNEIIDKNIKKLNISYKEIKQEIDQVYYNQDDIYSILNEKLENLKGYALNYYNTIKESYNYLKKYIDSSLYEIDEELNLCTNVTYKTFNQKYENISKNYASFDEEINKNDKKDEEINDRILFENFAFESTTEIMSINENARFKYNLSIEEEGEGKMKEVKIAVNIINKIKPIKPRIKLKEFSSHPCPRTIQKIDIDFDKVSYTTNFYFDSKFKIMNMSIDKDIIYKYTITDSEIKEDDHIKCYIMGGIPICDNILDCKEANIANTQAKEVIIQEKGNTTSIKI